MDEYNKVIKTIKKTFNYDLMCSLTEVYLEKYDKGFLNHYLNREQEIDYIYSTKIETMNIIFLLSERLPKTHQFYSLYLDQKNYIITNYLKKLKLISNHSDVDSLEFGLGFIFFMKKDLFKEEIVRTTFASFFLENIFIVENDQFYHSLKKCFLNEKQLTQYGLKRYMINYLRNYDDTLANYIETHINLLSKDLLLNINKRMKNKQNKKYSKIISLRQVNS